MDHFFKSSLSLLQYRFCFMFCFLGPKAWGILAPQPGIKLTPPVLEGQVLTIGPPGKSLFYFILFLAFSVLLKYNIHTAECMYQHPEWAQTKGTHGTSNQMEKQTFPAAPSPHSKTPSCALPVTNPLYGNDLNCFYLLQAHQELGETGNRLAGLGLT